MTLPIRSLKNLFFVSIACTALLLPATAFAQGSGRALQLTDSPPLDKAAMAEAIAGGDLPQFKLRGLAQAEIGAVAKSADSFFQTSETEEVDEEVVPQPGCRIEPSSPAIGANVPETYFGVPSPTANPSLVGPVQLLTSGQLDTRRRTIQLPLYRGRMAGTNEPVFFIATDTTDAANAESLGINFSAKLAFAETGRGVRNATLGADGELIFEAGTVDFSPVREVVAAAEPTPFPPVVAQPGSVGDSFYTPLVRIENAGGHIYNLPVIAFGTPANALRLANGDVDYAKVHDSVAQIRPFAGDVTLDLVPGQSFGRPVLYLSTETNLPLAAALEGATYAPGLEDITVGNDDSLFSAVERIFGFTNGPRGCDNPHRQGFEAAVTDGAPPFNTLGGIPTVAGDYSPLWDLNLGEWTQEAIDAGYRARLIDEFQILSFVEFGFVTGPGGTEYGSSGIIINCPIVHRFL